MDHHCPWVYNCVGFYNRKYFMQLLFYLLILTIYIDVTTLAPVYDIVVNLYTFKFTSGFLINKAISLAAFTVSAVISVMVSIFFKFHISLVLHNTTTIEALEPKVWLDNKFNLSKYDNWLQVFGENKYLWFIPLSIESGRPVGDGLTWKTNIMQDNSSNYKNTEPVTNIVKPSPSNNISEFSNPATPRDRKIELSRIVKDAVREEQKVNIDQYFESFRNKEQFKSVMIAISNLVLMAMHQLLTLFWYSLLQILRIKILRISIKTLSKQ